MKIKIDKYVVPGKKRSYEILMFPNYQNMYTYDAHPREEMYEVDGDEEAVRALAAGAAILAGDPSKILYFPCKKRGFWMNDGYNLVMARPELQFRRSQWYRLKPKLDKRHWRGKYVFNYQPGKLVDYYVGLENDWRWKGWEKKERKKYVSELLGDTVFWILPRNLCYEYHAYLAENVKAFQEENFKVQLGYVGWLIVEKPRKNMEHKGKRKGFVMVGHCDVQRDCKLKPIKDYFRGLEEQEVTQYIGIAIDEPKRLQRLSVGKESLLAKYGYTEEMVKEKAEQYGLLSPCYNYSKRGGCWFCPNAREGELKHLRNNHNNLWQELLRLEKIPDKIGDIWNTANRISIQDIEEREVRQICE